MRLSPGLRKLALAIHLTASVGWVGAVSAYLVLDLTVATTSDPEAVRAAWIGMGLIVPAAIAPLALASLLTGVVMSLGTKWGLFRHWWIIISLVLTLIAAFVLVIEMRVISSFALIAADSATTDDELLALPGTLVHSIGGLLVLLTVQVLNVYKPQGVTPYGWRRQDAERRALTEQVET